MQNRDIQSVRVVGMLTFGLGLILLILTTLTSLIALFNAQFDGAGQFVQAAAGAATAFIMASTMLSSGAVIGTMRPGHIEPDRLRLTWTALFAVMFLGAVANLWLVPALTVAACIVLLALLIVREAVIRLTSV